MSATNPSSGGGMRSNTWAAGIALFGAVALATLGVFQFFEGLSAVLKDQVFVQAGDYVFKLDITAWGWIHLILGVIAVVVGLCIIANKAWALIAGIVIAVLSAATNFMFLPYYPLWALVIIAFDIAVIWALSTVFTSRD